MSVLLQVGDKCIMSVLEYNKLGVKLVDGKLCWIAGEDMTYKIDVECVCLECGVIYNRFIDRNVLQSLEMARYNGRPIITCHHCDKGNNPKVMIEGKHNSVYLQEGD